MTEPRTYRTDTGDDYLTLLAAALDREAGAEVHALPTPQRIADGYRLQADRRAA